MSPIFLITEIVIILLNPKLQLNAQGVVDYCKPNICANGGTCVERVDGYVCECTVEYTGLHCDIPDYCRSAPCLHGGTCRDTPTSYVCNCNGTGYDGFTCHVPFDDCKSGPCKNGGACIDGFKSYSCQCISGFVGNECEIELSACVSNPCQNGGTCIDTHPGTSPGQLSPGFKCQCVEGTAGDRCEVNYDDCWMKPCQHAGVCVDGVSSYTCDCSGSGYFGVHCDIKNIDKCLLNPCTNGGTCVQVGDDYRCDCLPFQEGLITHGGKNCSVLLRGCENIHTCQNGGVCVPVLLNEANNIHSYTCSCPNGYRGNVCDAITTMNIVTGSYIRKTYRSDFTLKMRFRTGDTDGVLLYNRIGEKFVSVEIVNGSLYLVYGDNSGYNITMEAITTSEVSDSHWHRLVLTSGANTTLTLDDPLCNSTDDCVLSIAVPPHSGSFREIYIGHVTISPWLKATKSSHELTGCIQDVMFNGDVVITSNFGVAEFHNTKLSCPACFARTCNGIGHCSPVGNTGFQCACPAGIQNGKCPDNNGITCNFDQGLCHWTQSTSDAFDWIRNKGTTGSSGTGPSGDHTTGSGYYMYTEASSPRTSGQKAVLLSPYFDVFGPTCLTYWVNMNGISMGQLSLFQQVSGRRTVLKTLSGNHNDRWMLEKVQLKTGTHTRLEFEGTRGSDLESDMAIDDIVLSYKAC